ncbi:MAG TPA: hypothetical protein DE036_04135 [Actinobacteria bacterium]|nr:hypothetical protein [Actinomycetota bacterium]
MEMKRILPVAIIVLALLSLLAFAMYKPNAETALPGPVGQLNTTQQNQGQAQQAQPQAAPQAAPAPIPNEVVSSSEPATVVPDGTDLKQYCEKYYSAWKAADWQTAYDLQPLSKKEKSDVDGTSQQLQGYGMVGYTIGEPQIDKNIAVMGVNLDLGQNGIWKTSWTFVKNDKGQWTVQDSVTGMVQ